MMHAPRMAPSTPTRSRKKRSGADSEAPRTLAELDQVGPPSHVDAERYILGAILRDNTVLQDLQQYDLQEADFYDPTLQEIFRLSGSLYARGIPVDLITLTKELGPVRAREMGSTALLAALLEAVPAPVGLAHYAKMVRDAARMRAILTTCRRGLEEAIKGEVEPGTLVGTIESQMYQISSTGRTDTMQPTVSLMRPVVDEIRERWGNKSPVTGVPTGFVDLDKRINGLRGTDLIIVAARPGMGKTSFVLNIAENIAMREGGLPVLVFSLEMSKEQLLYRLVSSRASIEAPNLQRGLIDNEQFRTITEVASEIERAPLWLDDDPTISVEQMLSKTRHLSNRLTAERLRAGDPTPVKFGCVVVDYLQLMVGKNYDSREREISEISRGLKLLAKQLNVPVIALSQLNRSLEKRPDKRPVMSDLRESGAIEQDADLILFIYREDMYNKLDGDKLASKPEETPQTPTDAEIIVGKNRHGPTGTVTLSFDGRFTRFRNRASEDYGY